MFNARWQKSNVFEQGFYKDEINLSTQDRNSALPALSVSLDAGSMLAADF
jgi:hypothetical protein